MARAESVVAYRFSLLIAAWLVGLLVGPRAYAEDALACPPRLARPVSELPAAQRSGLLWEVRSPDGAVGHLFGTIHVSDPQIAALVPKLVPVLAASRRFGMEVLFDPPTLTALARAMWAGAGEGLADRAEPALFMRAQQLLGAYGLDPEAVRALKPWAAYTTLSLPRGQSGPPLDLELMTIAQRAGKSLFGIETLTEQLGIFETLSDEDTLALLRDTVCHYDAQQHDLRMLVAAYVRGDLGTLYRIAQRYESAAQRRLSAQLLAARNARMAERLLPYYAEAGTFVAVGALHLPGTGGLLERFAAAGFRVRPIDL